MHTCAQASSSMVPPDALAQRTLATLGPQAGDVPEEREEVATCRHSQAY